MGTVAAGVMAIGGAVVVTVVMAEVVVHIWPTGRVFSLSAAVVVLVVFASGVATRGEPGVSSLEGLATVNVLDWGDKVAATVSVSEEAGTDVVGADTDVVGLLEQIGRDGAAPDL